MSASGGRKNRLARESSPYLLLHAENPVDWYAWGDEAFAEARRADKPIFLSVGYSTCYWCHVMEREVFSNPDIAEQMNAGFVNIKLDREERPELDEIYMTATQLLTRAGGWPNSLFLTHDLAPFYAGTYFPPQDGLGRPGFPRVLTAIREAWEQRRESVLEQAESLAEAMREQMGAEAATPGLLLSPDSVGATLSVLSRRFDPEWGGFGPAPKFPSPSNLFFLLDLARQGDEEAQRMLVVTLDRMARGGIHDQIGGGFHRYSTDDEWLVPHFEKMLYDNAALATLYAEAASLSPESGFEPVARATLDFVLAELTGPEGGFLSAIDAETDGHEGAYYTWTRQDLEGILDPESFKLLALVYGFGGGPTFERDRHVLHLPLPHAERARTMGLTLAELQTRIEPGRRALMAARWKRKRPLVDDKILADWNGLMIAAMARAGTLLHEPRYVEAGARAARFVLEKLAAADGGTLRHVYREGQARIPALLDDYVFLVEAFLELQAATGDPSWGDAAARVQAEQDLRLWDETGDGYFSAGTEPHLLFRAKTAHDGAVASGNGVAALNLIRLGELRGDAAYGERAGRVLKAFSQGISEWPLAHVSLVRALARWSGSARPVAPPQMETSALPEAPAESSPSPLEATARAVVEIRGRLRPAPGPWRPFAVDLVIRSGWHVNANPSSEPFLIPTEVRPSEGALRGLRYPVGDPLRSELSPQEIAVYGSLVRIEGEIEVAGEGTPSVAVTYQACDETRCLPPVTRQVPLV